MKLTLFRQIDACNTYNKYMYKLCLAAQKHWYD